MCVCVCVCDINMLDGATFVKLAIFNTFLAYVYMEPAARLQFSLADGDWNQLGGDLFIPREGTVTCT